MDSIHQFESRKRDHIDHALNPRNQSSEVSGFDRVRLIHEALPELDIDEVSLTHLSLGKMERTPFFIAGMTAGHPQAHEINLRLAMAAERRGWTMGVGSQRRELAGNSFALPSSNGTVDRWKELRKKAPHVTLYANLGISQVIGATVDEIKRLVESLEASALAIHLNPLQEALQKEGTPFFFGGLAAIENCVSNLGLPVVIKETGCGFSESTLTRIRNAGVSAVDVSGLGGTHWGRIEGNRADPGSVLARAAETFANWGETTVDSILSAKKAFAGSTTEVWASGGIRSGLDAAKCVAIGAHRMGFAQPVLQAALASIKDGDTLEPLERWMEQIEFELKVALFCTGSATPSDLRENPRKCEANASRER